MLASSRGDRESSLLHLDEVSKSYKFAKQKNFNFQVRSRERFFARARWGGARRDGTFLGAKFELEKVDNPAEDVEISSASYRERAFTSSVSSHGC